MYDLTTNRGDIRNDLIELIRCFIDGSDADIKINHTYVQSGNISVYVSVSDKLYKYEYPLCLSTVKTEYARYDLYVNKTSLYRAFSDYFGKRLPWGSLTGIRPTRLAVRLQNSGVKYKDIASELQTEYYVSKSKAELTAEILRVQNSIITDRTALISPQISDLVNLYVHIPFCPTRCAYCSFVSEGVEKKNWLLLPYIDALIKEISYTKELIEKQGKRIFSVYVGGGTPTVLSPELLRKVSAAAYSGDVEYTCEAGRPDTIDNEKLSVLNECGVNRISINPQTLHDATLKRIGRAHTSEQFFRAYQKAAKFGFVKNVDLIAGLTGESPDDFIYTLDNIVALAPENVTVHTLCVKRGSSDSQNEISKNSYAQEMVDYSVRTLKKSGYVPYYLYRQKQMTANLENIGWCKSGFMCVNNISVMEETIPVYACGAGAISKIIAEDGKIQRLANPKDVLLYLDQFYDRMKKKEAFYLTNT